MSADTSRQALLDALSDERPEPFAALKKLLKGPPTAKQWRRLCEELKRWEDCEPQTFEALLSYIKETIAPWYRHFEPTMPAQWLARLKRDEPCPQLSLFDSLEITSAWDVASYAQNVKYLSSLKSLRHETLTPLNESSLSLMLHQLDLGELTSLRLNGPSRAQLGQELELLAELAALKLPALSHLYLKRLNICPQTLSAWLDSSWAPWLTQLTLASACITTPHLRHLFEAAQDGRLQPSLHLALPSTVMDENGHLHQERAQVVQLHTSYVWDYDLGYMLNYELADTTEDEDPYPEDVWVEDVWE